MKCKLKLMSFNDIIKTNVHSSTIEELLEKQNSNIEAQSTVEEAKVAIERERTWHAKLTEQTAVNQNLQNDLRLLYVKHKKDLAELQEQYQVKFSKQFQCNNIFLSNIMFSTSNISKDIWRWLARGTLPRRRWHLCPKS